MRKISLIVLLAIAVLSSCNLKKTAQETEKDSRDTLQHALLWEITGNELEQPSYLFGTIHLIEKDKFFWPEGTLKAFDESQQVIFEIDMNIMQDMSAVMDVMDRMYMKNDTTLSMLIDEEEYAEVRNYFQSQGLPAMFFERIKPLFLSAMVGMDMSGGGIQSNENIKSYEMEFQEMAEASAKDVAGLETIDLQLSMIDKVPLKVQARMLYTAIQAEKEGVSQMDALSRLYISQNINKMVQDIADSKEMGEYSSVLLDNRNQKWIPMIDSFVQQKPSFIAVGAGHLGGDQGVIKLLRKEGYELTPLSKTK